MASFLTGCLYTREYSEAGYHRVATQANKQARRLHL